MNADTEMAGRKGFAEMRSKIIAAVVIGSVLAGAGVAAAAVGSDDSSTGGAATTTTAAAATTTTTAPTTTTEPVAQTSEDATSGPARSTDGCDGQEYRNHGEFVSSVAHDPDREPGDVAAAAHADCGKPLAAGSDDADTADDEDDRRTGDTTTSTEGSSNTHGQGHGHGNGHD